MLPPPSHRRKLSVRRQSTLFVFIVRAYYDDIILAVNIPLRIAVVGGLYSFMQKAQDMADD